jgi:protein-disulfide isomerase
MRSKELFLNIATGIVTICTVVVTGTLVYGRLYPSPAGMVQEDRKVADWQVQLSQGRRIGPANAAVTVLEYGDFECPACAGFFKEFEAARSKHPQDIALVFRHFPLKYHAQAYPSARAAECAAEQGRFEGMYRTLYSSHDSLGKVPFREFARRAGVTNLEGFDVCMANTEPVPRIEADLKTAIEANIPGTPGVIINGVLKLRNLPNSADLERLVEDSRARR